MAHCPNQLWQIKLYLFHTTMSGEIRWSPHGGGTRFGAAALPYRNLPHMPLAGIGAGAYTHAAALQLVAIISLSLPFLPPSL